MSFANASLPSPLRSSTCLTSHCTEAGYGPTCMPGASRVQPFATPWTMARQTPSVHVIFQARISGVVAISSYRDLPIQRSGTFSALAACCTASVPLLLSHQGIPLTCSHRCTFFPPFVRMTYSLTYQRISIEIYILGIVVACF